MEDVAELFKKKFQYYRQLGEDTMAQLTGQELFWQPNAESNSVAVIVQHIAGNMLSRWTNFLTEDGEKTWRNRDQEFILQYHTREEVMDYWEKGWKALNDALSQLNENNLGSSIFIRGEKHSVLDALLRQLAHYPYHIGQMVYIGKLLRNERWETLSIARNSSEEFNREKFAQETGDDLRDFSSPVCFAKSEEIRDEYRDEEDNEPK